MDQRRFNHIKLVAQIRKSGLWGHYPSLTFQHDAGVFEILVITTVGSQLDDLGNLLSNSRISERTAFSAPKANSQVQNNLPPCCVYVSNWTLPMVMRNHDSFPLDVLKRNDRVTDGRRIPHALAKSVQ